MNNQSVDSKCFLINIKKKDFKFEDKWGGLKTGEERNLHKIYNRYNKTTNIIEDEVIYNSSFQEAKEKVLEIVKKDMESSDQKMIKERAVLESEHIREKLKISLNETRREIKDSHFKKVLEDLNWSRDRSEGCVRHYEAEIHNKPFSEITDEFILEQNEKKKAEQEKLQKICKELEEVNEKKRLLEEKEKKISGRLDTKYNSWYEDIKRWHEETAKTLYEDLRKVIKSDLHEDYEFQVKELKYIILKSNTVIGLSEQVNDHLVKGWEVLGGVQIGGSGGGDGGMRDWSEYRYVQSLVCGS